MRRYRFRQMYWILFIQAVVLVLSHGCGGNSRGTIIDPCVNKCSSDSVCDDHNQETTDTCVNAGSCNAYCENNPSAGWTELGTGSASGGGISATNAYSYSPDITHNSAGEVFVAWVEHNISDSEVFLKKWNGAAWIELGSGTASNGGISNNAGYSFSPAIAIDHNGYPIVTWSDDTSGRDEIYVKRWDGSNWVEIGSGSGSGSGISNTSGPSSFPAITMYSDNNPIIAWNDSTTGTSSIYIKRWDGSEWVEMGVESATGTGISGNVSAGTIHLATNSNGDPIVAWDGSDLDAIENGVYVKHWDGSNWVESGTDSASGGGIANLSGYYGWSPWHISMTTDLNGDPIVAWPGDNSDSGDFGVFVKYWNSTSWIELGENPVSGDGSSYDNNYFWKTSIKTDSNGTPILAWSRSHTDEQEVYHGEISVVEWDGTEWTEVGTIPVYGDNEGELPVAESPAITVLPSGTVVMAWTERFDSVFNIYVKKHSRDL